MGGIVLVEVTLSRRERDLTGQDGGILLVEVTDRAGERDLMGQDGGIVVVEVTVLDRGVRRESTTEEAVEDERGPDAEVDSAASGTSPPR